MSGISANFSGLITKKRSCSFGGGAGTKGNCFSISASSVLEEKANCFSSSSYNRPCFYIKCEEAYDEYIELNDIDFADLDFVSIKCVQAHGVGKIVVVGTYLVDTVATDVIASVLFTPATDGGINKIDRVYTYAPLSDYNTVEFGEVTSEVTLSDVARVDGYDIQSGTSSICLVLTDGTAIWLNPLILTEQSRQSDGGVDPYFNEDSYSVAGVKTSIETYSKTWTTASTNYTAYYGAIIDAYSRESNPLPPFEFFDFDKEILFNPNCASPDITCHNSTSSYTTPTDNERTTITRLQTSGGESYTDVPGKYAKDVQPAELLDYVGSTSVNLQDGMDYTILNSEPHRKRKGIFIIKNPDTDEQLLYAVDANSLINEPIWKRICQTDTDIRSYHQYRLYGTEYHMICNMSEVPISIGTHTLEGIKLAISDSYVMVGNGTGMDYFKIDLTHSCSISNAKNSTIIKGVAVIADGTTEITQTILDDIV